MTSLYLICVRDGIIWLNFCAFAKQGASPDTHCSRLDLILSHPFLAVKKPAMARLVCPHLLYRLIAADYGVDLPCHTV